MEVVRNIRIAVAKTSNIKSYRNRQSKHKFVNTAICLQNIFVGLYLISEILENKGLWDCKQSEYKVKKCYHSW